MSRTHHVHTQRRATVQRRSRIGAPRRFPALPPVLFCPILVYTRRPGRCFQLRHNYRDNITVHITLWTHLVLAGPSTHVPDACIATEGSRIAWAGPRAELPSHYQAQARQTHNLNGALVMPGLVDCHTHLVFGGHRAEEFALRLSGASYEEIARRGGGIVSTVRATRAASEDELFTAALRRLDAMIAEGVTALEIKSGYGLDLPTERKMLRVARRLAQARPVSIRTTFLGAHALPPEYAGRADAYIDHVCHDMLPQLVSEGLVDAVDVFCEGIGFNLAQSERMLQAAQHHGLNIRIHAEQLSLLGGAALAARYKALSADHLEYLDEDGVMAMRDAGMVAVLLPGAYYFIRETQLPPVELLRTHQVPIAISTDCNPGTSPNTSLLQMMNMACTLFRLSVDEVVAGVTTHAAQALGHPAVTGRIAPGEMADFAVYDIESVAELAYWSGLPRCVMTVRHGEVIYQRPQAMHSQAMYPDCARQPSNFNNPEP